MFFLSRLLALWKPMMQFDGEFLRFPAAIKAYSNDSKPCEDEPGSLTTYNSARYNGQQVDEVPTQSKPAPALCDNMGVQSLLQAFDLVS
jgi:hypothetical protein